MTIVFEASSPVVERVEYTGVITPIVSIPNSRSTPGIKVKDQMLKFAKFSFIKLLNLIIIENKM